ncbi:MAG: A/G-specific adenine glycosylase [Rhodospirillales bacterium]|nr:A/G-specific adenine glycosylase [Rhodospirillales bacterium]
MIGLPGIRNNNRFAVTSSSSSSSLDSLRRRTLLAWYDRNRRRMPWRSEGGEPSDPYKVWLSEAMLQQTQVKTVIPYFEDFISRWPRVEDLAAAELDQVLHAWQGLGYYARARNLHKCARIVAHDLGGRFPSRESDLHALPGIGPYTSAAIAAIAFGAKVVPVDGNVIRVMARIHAVEEPLPAGLGRINALARGLAGAKRSGDFAQALMDLGATVCTPRSPDCSACPWQGTCTAKDKGLAAAFPRKAAKKTKPVRRGVAYFIQTPDDSLLLRRRAEKGLLGGMMEVPSTDWRETPWTDGEARTAAYDFIPPVKDLTRIPGVVTHTFTHFHLELTVFAGRTQNKGAKVKGVPGKAGDREVWCRPEKLRDLALPTVIKKVIDHAQEMAKNMT